MPEQALLSVRELRTIFPTRRGVVKAVDGVSFDLFPGKTLGIVGESGSGKSITALSLVRLIPPPGRIVSGQVVFEGRDLLTADERTLRHVRGGRIGFIFQDPMTSLNPVFTIGDQIIESLVLHTELRGAAARKRAIALLDMVGIPSPNLRVDNYPHEFSGGMRQRAMIAVAIACQPVLLIGDEPTTALDVTIQAQVLDLLRELQHELGMALILISHDLGVVATTCAHVAVMYGGRIVEATAASEIFDHPQHPYTRGLLECRPQNRSAAGRLMPIPGTPPNPAEPIWEHRCAFEPRCPVASAECSAATPDLLPVGHAGHLSRCLVAQRGGGLAGAFAPRKEIALAGHS